MADYWKSHEKYFCDVCKCWMQNHKAVIRHHESGMRHKGNVQAKLKEIGRKTHEKIKDARETMSALQAMEAGALASFSKDLSKNPSVAAAYSRDLTEDSSSTAEYGPTFKPAAPQSTTSSLGSVAGAPLPNYHAKRASQNAQPQQQQTIVWAVAKSEEGHDYYWNMQTETSWEPPSCPFLTYADQEAESSGNANAEPDGDKATGANATKISTQRDRSKVPQPSSSRRAAPPPSDSDDSSESDEADEDAVDHSQPEAQGGRAGENPFGEWTTLDEGDDKQEFRHSFKDGHTRPVYQEREGQKRYKPIKRALKVKPEDVVTQIEEDRGKVQFAEKTISQPVSGSRFKKATDSAPVTFKKRRVAAQNNRTRNVEDE